MDDCVDAAVAVLDTAGIDRAAWVGLSWGGMVGMRLAARRPERVAALVLMDTSARRERPWKKAAYRPLEAIAGRFGPVLPLAKRIIAPIMFSRHGLANEVAVDAFVQTLIRMDAESLTKAVDAVIFERDDVTDELQRISGPTLVMVGEEDRATPPSESEHLVAHIRGARLVRIGAAGHLSAVEQPTQVTLEILSFLARNTA
jgi:pimeloyl-ACP methyl ester carboxylesterase